MNSFVDEKSKQMCLFNETTPRIGNSELCELIYSWEKEDNPIFKDKLKAAVLAIIEIKEREAFIARFRLKEFDTWNKVLTEEEGAVSQAHKAEFYKPYLILTIYENNSCLPALDAINKTVEKVKDKLFLADYKLTASKRFRYDTTIRFLANALKKQEIISSDKKFKNKYWALTDKGKKLAEKLKEEGGNTQNFERQ